MEIPTEQQPTMRTVTLRNQRLDSGIHSALWAWVDPAGDLHLDGQDLGLPPGMMSDDTEYEYFEDRPRIVRTGAKSPRGAVPGRIPLMNRYACHPKSPPCKAGTVRSRHLSKVIYRSPAEVYAYASDPDNLPAWAAGLARSEVTRDGATLIVESTMGRVSVRFTPPNVFGVLDHDVTMPSGETVNNPVRVVSHPEGCEIVFTVRQRDLSDAEFDRDTEAVAADLTRLKNLIEAEGGENAHD